MFLIESTNPKRWRWLSGVFQDRTEAESGLGDIPTEQRMFHRLTESGPSHFPVFIVENQGFECLSLHDLLKRLEAIEPKGDEDFVHFNVYALCATYRPRTPGRDEMGSLLHWHVTDDTLRSPRAGVFLAELRELAQ